jgi:hypothetical protein
MVALLKAIFVVVFLVGPFHGVRTGTYVEAGRSTILIEQDRQELDKEHMSCQYFDANGKTLAPEDVYVLGCGIDIVVEKATSVEMVVFSYDSKPMPIKIEVIKR